MHGILLVLRHLICEINYSPSANESSQKREKAKGTGGTMEVSARIFLSDIPNLEEWRQIMSDMLEHATRASMVALHVVAGILILFFFF